MKNTGRLLALLGASCVVAFASAAPAEARPKPCCYNDGDYYNASPSTCRRYGGRVVPQDYCDRGYYDDGYGYGRSQTRIDFAIQLGDVVIAYSDGYYDRHRRWHRWRSDRERDWYRRHRHNSYYHMPRDRDRDHRRRDWRDGRRHDWR
jgi:hypothetical protein